MTRERTHLWNVTANEAAELGLCTKCKLMPASDGKRLCPECRTANSRYQAKLYDDLKDKVMRMYGEECYCCGESNKLFLTIEHLGNWGKNHRKASGGGTAMLKDILSWDYSPDYIAIACYNCNMAARYNGKCPHANAIIDYSNIVIGVQELEKQLTEYI